MKKRKFFAVVMAAVMTLSMVACGGEQTSNDVTPTTAPTATTAPTKAPDPTATPVPVPQNVTIADASITFEDGNMGFVEAYMDHARSANLELSLVDYNGSKAVKVVNTTGTSKAPFVAIDVSSLFGADVAKIAGVEMVIGTSYEDGSFHAASGEILSLWGAERDDNSLGTWSVYMEKKNPKIATGKIPAGNELVADAYNIVIVNLTTDNGASDAGIPAAFYIDDIRFYDAAGNTMKPADTTVAFNWPASNGPDLSNLYAVSNAVEFPGFTTSGAGWGQNGFDIPQEVLDAMVPGTVVEIEFSSADGTMWVVMPDSAAGWMRVGQGKAYINNSKTVAQIPYEEFEALLGADKTTWGARMQCEAQTDWEVYSVKVGKANKRMAVANAVEFEGFVTSGAGWGQNGFEMPQEIIDALVPGSVIEIDYASTDGTLWVVMPWAAAGWMRCGQGTAVCDGSKCYVTYEQIEEMCGTDKTTWGAMLQCESQTDWEVFGLRVGTKVEYPVLGGFVDFPDFVTSGAGWGQNGFEMPQAIIDALVPGSVVEISFASADNTMWIVMPDAAAGWSRCGQGTATIADGKAYVTYEQIAAVCGEDKSTWGARMQCEAQTDWEVFAVRVGQGPVPAGAATEEPEEKVEAPDPTIQVADGDVAFTSSKTFADASWWTQVDVSLADLLGGVDPTTVTAIKFTCPDTNFIVGYNDTLSGGWAQFDTSNTYVVKTCNFEGTDPIVCLYLSKGDSVEYTITWEVYTGGSTDIIVAEEPAEPVIDPTNDTIEGTVAYNSSLTFADSAWWTQMNLFQADLIGDLDPATVKGIKFTSDTTFVVGYTNVNTAAWDQYSDFSTYVVKAIDFNKTGEDPVVCLYLSKGDGVEYTINWEVYTDGEAAGTTDTPAVEEPAADAVTGTFSGTYQGDYAAEWIPADAFAGCDNGAVVTINFDRTAVDTRTWWNFTCIKADWSKYLDDSYYLEVPGYSQYEFLEMGAEGTTYTLKFSAEAVKAIQADGKLGLQTDGIIFIDYAVAPAK